MPNFTSSLFNTDTNVDLANSYSSVETIEDDDVQNIKSPIATSSPQNRKTTGKHDTGTAIGHTPKKSKYQKDNERLTQNKTQPERSKKKQKKQSRPIKVLVINFQSLKEKAAELAVYPSNYTVLRKDRKPVNDRAWGGVLIATKNDIISLHRPDLDVDGEIIWTQTEMAKGEKSMLVGAFYRPPSSDLAY